MRTSLTTLAAVLMLAGTSVYAQPASTGPDRSEGPFSPFTYERLGATPSIRLPWSTSTTEARAPVKERAAATEPAQSRARAAARTSAAPAQAAAPATATTH